MDVARKFREKEEKSMKFDISEELISLIRRILQETNFESGTREIKGYPGCRLYVTNGESPREAKLIPLSAESFPGLPENRKVFLVL